MALSKCQIMYLGKYLLTADFDPNVSGAFKPYHNEILDEVEKLEKRREATGEDFDIEIGVYENEVRVWPVSSA